MSDGAPVCPISRPQLPSGQIGTVLPTVPKAQDLPSAIQAINVLTQIVNILTGATPVMSINNVSPINITAQLLPALQRAAAGGSATTPAAQKARWVEVGRQKERVKVTNPDDESIFVIVDRINSITFRDTVTGSSMVWSR